jgi:hypothetical protein
METETADDPLETTRDPLGRTVHLTRERWEHIAYGHSPVAALRAQVMRAVREPTTWTEEKRPGEGWFYLEDVGPSRWLKVVVAYDDKSVGNVITAFPRRRHP